MDTVPAAENLSVELAPEAWRLLHSELRGSHELLSAGPDGALRYSEAFAWSRHLPASGALANGHVEQVVLGWSESDQAWHLGLLLTPQLAALRDSRWCELASWPDPDQSDFLELAERAGQSLAALTERPFQLIAPQAPAPAPQVREPLFEEAPSPPERPLPQLPLAFSDTWSLEIGTTGMLQLVRDPKVARAMTRRILWYALWAAVYVFLIVASHLSGIATSGPPFLPLLAAFSALVLVLLIARNLVLRHNAPDLIIIDNYQRQIRARRGPAVLWIRRAEQIQSIYVSELQRKRRRRGNDLHYGELNLHLSNNQFQHLLQSAQPRSIAGAEGDAAQSVSVLESHSYSTNTQAVALHIAQALDLPVWLDRRGD